MRYKMAEKNTKLILSNNLDVKTGEITVNDRAATRKAIINYLEKFLPVISKNKFLERSEWGARAANNGLEDEWDYTSIVIHHQGNSPQHICSATYGALREVQNNHMDKKDFSDIGYHYAVDCTGVIAESRDIRFKGSHVNKNNAKKIGILLLGDFSKPGEAKLSFKDFSTWTDQFDSDYMRKIPDAQLAALKVLIKCLKNFFEIRELGGHKEFALSDDTRTCPGSVVMEKIVELRKEFRLNKPTKVK